MVIVPWTRNERGATAGLEDDLLRRERARARVREERGASEAIFANTRDDCARPPARTCSSCATAWCATPPESAGCLLGVTRALVLELCAALGIAADEVDAADATRCATADEAFLSRRTREVQTDRRTSTARAARRHRAAGHRTACADRVHATSSRRIQRRESDLRRSCADRRGGGRRRPRSRLSRPSSSRTTSDAVVGECRRARLRDRRRVRARRAPAGRASPSRARYVGRVVAELVETRPRARRGTRRAARRGRRRDQPRGCTRSPCAASSAGTPSAVDVAPIADDDSGVAVGLRRGSRRACGRRPRGRSATSARRRRPATASTASVSASPAARSGRIEALGRELRAQQHRHQQRRTRRGHPRATEPAPPGGLLVGDRHETVRAPLRGAVEQRSGSWSRCPRSAGHPTRRPAPTGGAAGAGIDRRIRRPVAEPSRGHRAPQDPDRQPRRDRRPRDAHVPRARHRDRRRLLRARP